MDFKKIFLYFKGQRKAIQRIIEIIQQKPCKLEILVITVKSPAKLINLESLKESREMSRQNANQTNILETIFTNIELETNYSKISYSVVFKLCKTLLIQRWVSCVSEE